MVVWLSALDLSVTVAVAVLVVNVTACRMGVLCWTTEDEGNGPARIGAKEG